MEITIKKAAIKGSLFLYYEFDQQDGDEVVHIDGSKKLESLKEISFSTPGVSLIDDEYKYTTELKDAIDDLKLEVLAYMQGKSAPKAQLEMFEEVGAEDENSAL